MSQENLNLPDVLIKKLNNKNLINFIEVEIQRILVFENLHPPIIRNYKTKLIIRILLYFLKNFKEILTLLITLVMVVQAHKKIHNTEFNTIIIILA